jgi:hypothetical protein
VFVTTGLVTTGLTGGPVTGVRRGAARRSRTALHLPWHLLGLLRPPVPLENTLVNWSALSRKAR